MNLRVSLHSGAAPEGRLALMSAPDPYLLMQMIQWAQQGDREDFHAKIGGWSLVGPPITLNSDDWNYRTLSSRSVRDEGPGGDILVLRDTYAAYPLKKSRAGPFADTVLVGRSSSNDVRIAHTSVSKLHARVRYNAEGAPSISDAGSSNGTLVRDEKLPEGEWVQLSSGDVIQLGTCTFRVLDPERLYLLVKKFAG